MPADLVHPFHLAARAVLEQEPGEARHTGPSLTRSSSSSLIKGGLVVNRTRIMRTLVAAQVVASCLIGVGSASVSAQAVDCSSDLIPNYVKEQNGCSGSRTTPVRSVPT